MLTKFARARRLPILGVNIAVVVGLVAAAMLATGTASPAVAFQRTGHWVFNQSEHAVAHIDGGTHQVDARVAVPNAGADPLSTLQGKWQGFLVRRQSITVFGKSTLAVESTVPSAGSDLPVGIEVVCALRRGADALDCVYIRRLLTCPKFEL